MRQRTRSKSGTSAIKTVSPTAYASSDPSGDHAYTSLGTLRKDEGPGFA
jgi:hypothetical protein